MKNKCKKTIFPPSLLIFSISLGITWKEDVTLPVTECQACFFFRRWKFSHRFFHMVNNKEIKMGRSVSIGKEDEMVEEAKTSEKSI